MGIVIIGAMVVNHAQNGFYMNWFGVQKREGIEFDILFLAITTAITLNGSGKYSIDKWLSPRLNNRKKLTGKGLYGTDKVFG